MTQKIKTQKIGLVKYLLILPVAFALMFLSTAAMMPPAVEQVDELTEIAAVQNDDKVWDKVEQMAQFPGGNAAMGRWLRENMETQQDIRGTAIVQFIIEKDGTVSNVRVVPEHSPNPYLNAELIRVIRAMPRWQPAKQDGKAVRSRMTFGPISVGNRQ
jgi:TonB family protein